jgi:hypothetical protein
MELKRVAKARQFRAHGKVMLTVFFDWEDAVNH